MQFKWTDKGNKIFWFTEEDGAQVLVRPDGTTRADKPEKSEPHFKTRQGQEGYRRSLLLMDEYGVWDATAFGATMSVVFGFQIRGDAYLFTSCQNAETSIYPLLKKEIVEESVRLVDGFYADPNIQAGWPSLIVHPVCFKVTEEAYHGTSADEKPDLIPIAISDIGSSQDVLDNLKMQTIGRVITHDSLNCLFDTGRTTDMRDKPSPDDPFLAGNEIIEQAIAEFYQCGSVSQVLDAIRTRMEQDAHFMIPVETSEDGGTFSIRTVSDGDGNPWMALFTSRAEYEKGPRSDILSNFMDTTLKACLDTGGTGFVINPWGQGFILRRDMIEALFENQKPAPKPVKKPAKKPEPDLEGLVLTLKSKEKDCQAIGALQKKKKILVKAGSKISLESRLHLNSGTEKNAQLRAKLIESGVIRDRIFTEDYLFNSPSQAATVILGTSFSGNDRWRDKNGVTLGKRLGKG